MIRSCRSLIRGVVLAAGVLTAGGCGDGGASISGDVTYNGQPVKEGYITFAPKDGKGPTVGGAIAGGKYSVEKVLPGPKVVKVEATDKPPPSVQSSADAERLSKEMKGKFGPDGIIRAGSIPRDAEGNNAPVEVQSGSQTLNFDLKSPAGRK